MSAKSLKLASGGHATVWLARSGTDLVARKLPHAHLMDDPEMRAALRREAEIALRLRHPNVVRLRGIELEDEVPVLVMDYIEGTTLADLVRDWIKHERRDTARAALRIVLDAAEGLHALHELRNERGEPLALVHRDISPQNVLVGVDGLARVSDFGLTKCLATDRATTEGVLKGKAGYLAPEYVRGERGDRRLDVFSLAIVAWEALTRARLFRGDNDAATLDRVLTMVIPSIADKAPELEAAAAHLDPVLRRALERDPADRYDSAAAFAHSLRIAAERAGLVGSEDDVKASFSPALTHELAERRSALEPKAKGMKWMVVAGLALLGGVAVAGVKSSGGAATATATTPATATATTPTSTSTSTSTPTPSPTETAAALPAPQPLSAFPLPTTEVMALPDSKGAPPPPPSRPKSTAKVAPSEPPKPVETPAKPRPNPY